MRKTLARVRQHLKRCVRLTQLPQLPRQGHVRVPKAGVLVVQDLQQGQDLLARPSTPGLRLEQQKAIAREHLPLQLLGNVIAGFPGRCRIWGAAQQQALENALTLAEPEPGLRSDAHEMLAYLRFEAGFVAQALSHADAALLAAENDPSRRARALVRRAWVDIATGRGEDDHAPGLQRLDAWLHEAVALARACDDQEAQARALHQMAVIASHHRQDWVGAEAMLAQSQSLWLALGDRRKANARLRNRAQCWIRLGRRQEALDCFRQCERWAHEDGDWVGQIDSMCSLSSLLAARRQWAQALAIDQRCVALCWQRWHRHGLGYALWNPPRSLAHLRRPEAAMKLMSFAVKFWETSFGPLTRGDRQTVRRVRGLVKAQLGAVRTQALWDEGQALNIAQAVALALQPPNPAP